MRGASKGFTTVVIWQLGSGRDISTQYHPSGWHHGTPPPRGYFMEPNKSTLVMYERNLARAEIFLQYKGQAIVTESLYMGVSIWDTRQQVLCACSAKNVKKRTFIGVCTSYVFLTLLRNFVPHLEILFCINHYFIVCIFKYYTSSHVNSGLEI